MKKEYNAYISEQEKLNNNESGFAVILAMWLVVIISTVIVTYTYNMMEEARLIDNYKKGAQTEFYANAGINRAVDFLMKNRQNMPSLPPTPSPIINEVRGRINDIGIDKSYEYIELYNPTSTAFNMTNYKIKISADAICEKQIVSWSTNFATNVGQADTRTTILYPGCYALILAPSYTLDTSYYYDAVIPQSTIILSLQGDVSGQYLGGVGIGGTTGSVSGSANHIVISEVAYDSGGTTNEFVELYNPTGSDINITDWKLKRYTSTGSSSNYKIFGTATIKSHHFYLISFGSIGITNDTDASAGSLAPDNSIALFNSGGSQIDLVGYGSATNVEGSAAPLPGAGSSIERKASMWSTAASMYTGGSDALNGNAYDTDNNNFDFVVQGKPIPQNSSSEETPPAATGGENTWRTIIQLVSVAAPGTVLSEVILDTDLATGYIQVGGPSYERMNFMNATSAIFDSPQWVISKGIPADIERMPGSPGFLNLSVKFSNDVGSTIPYTCSDSTFWRFLEDIDNDGDTDYAYYMRPSLGKFNVNHKLDTTTGTTDYDYITNVLYYYFYILPTYALRATTGKNILLKSPADDCSKELGGYYKLPDDICLVSYMGEQTYKEFQDAVTVYPSDVNRFKLFPININAMNDSALASYFGSFTPKCWASGSVVSKANSLKDKFVTKLFTNNDKFDGASGSNNFGAFQEFVDFVLALDDNLFAVSGPNALLKKYQFLQELRGGVSGIPLVFGPTWQTGKYTFWEIFCEGYDNWTNGKPKTVTRVRADVAIPVYADQPTDNKAKIIYWSEDCPTSYWHVTDY